MPMSNYQPFKLFVGVYILLKDKDSNILFLKRTNTRWASGLFSLISGFIDGDESIIDAAKREVKEETGIIIKNKNLNIFHAMHRKSGDAEFIDFFISAENWVGNPKNLEPNKCSEIKWFPIKMLPKNIVPHLKTVLDYYQKSKPFSESGF